jgi:hypothetical protein
VVAKTKKWDEIGIVYDVADEFGVNAPTLMALLRCSGWRWRWRWRSTPGPAPPPGAGRTWICRADRPSRCRQHPANDHPEVAEPTHCPVQEDGVCLALLFGEDFDVGDPAVVIDGNMDVVPTLPGAGAQLGFLTADPAAAAVRDTADFLDVDKQEVAGVAVFVTDVPAGGHRS